MKQIDFIIETLAPVAFSEKNSDSTLYTTKKYVPGTAVRGCLASRFISSRKLGEAAHEDPDFYDIFLSGKIKFLPAYPVGENTDDEESEPFILPLSLMKHKSANKIIDLSKRDSRIEAGYKKFAGFAVQKDGSIYKAETKTQIQLHIARSKNSARITGSSRDGDIFNYEFIEPNQYFKGSFIADDDIAAKKLIEFLHESAGIVYLGRSKLTQYGRCSFKIQNMSECRIKKINVSEDFYLYAYTPYIPFAQWQRADEAARELLSAIEKRVQAKYPDVKIMKDGIKIFAANEEVGGYVNVWKARQERKTALSAGSLIQLKAENIMDGAAEFLNETLYQGAGWRSIEGFGQFRLWQASDSVKLKEFDAEEPVCPKHLELVKDKARIIIQKRIMAEVRKKAKETADSSQTLSENKKHILNRVEELMDSSLSKAEIQEKIKDFKKNARSSLRSICIKNDSHDNLCDILLEENGAVMPYAGAAWEDELGLKDKKEQMKKDLGADIFSADENVVYRHFWLWFVRHAKKNMNDKTIQQLKN